MGSTKSTPCVGVHDTHYFPNMASFSLSFKTMCILDLVKVGLCKNYTSYIDLILLLDSSRNIFHIIHAFGIVDIC
jgi:hypothetical protein